MDENSELSEDELDALQAISENDGIYQSELADIIDVSDWKGGDLARSLESMELIEREKVSHNGSQTYVLNQAPKDPKELDFSLLLAGDMLPPFIGEDKIDHQSEGFTQWLMNLEAEYDPRED